MKRLVDSARGRTQRNARARGFTLVEIAVVMVVVGLLMMSMLLPLSAQLEQKAASDTLRRLEDAREALLAYALINGRLPCPATGSTTVNPGLESPQGGGSCDNSYGGYLPARTLSFYPQNSDGYATDAWNNPIRYVISSVSCTVGAVPTLVSNVFTTTSGMKSVVQLSTSGFGEFANSCKPDLAVCSTSTGASATACASDAVKLTNSGTVVAILYSTGKNGANGADSTNRPDEAANLNGDRVFVSHLPAPDGATGGEFDDIMIWISAGTLFNRMIAAGVLP